MFLIEIKSIERLEKTVPRGSQFVHGLYVAGTVPVTLNKMCKIIEKILMEYIESPV